MRTTLLTYLTGIALAAGMISAAASGASVATIPAGMISYAIPHGTSTLLSLPLTNTETFTSTVSAVTANTIAVADTPAPFTKSMAPAITPYFVKFLSGTETGRVLLITSNTTSVLTLDVADHGTGSVPLTSSDFAVQPGDAFEIFPGDTISSIFGAGTAQNPLILTGGASPGPADTVALVSVATIAPVTYYFNTTDGHWEQFGAGKANANNGIIYPYCAMVIFHQQTSADAVLIVSGRVTPVGAQTKVVSLGTVYTSTHFATDVKLSQLNFGANWVMGSNINTADNLSVWNASANRFDTYYQKPDSTWRRFPDTETDQSSVSIAAGTVTAIAKRTAAAGAATFVQSPLPYSLD